MSWLSSIGAGLCSGIVGFVIALFAAGVASDWYRIPQREGAAAIFVVGVALIVFVGAVVLGIVCARQVALAASSPFLKAVGTASAVIAGIAVVALAIAWLLADLSPKINGRRLELAVELSCPPGFTLPAQSDGQVAYATVMLASSGDTRAGARLESEHARMESGRLILPALMDLDTSVSKKLLRIQLDKEQQLTFPLDVGSRPGEKDLQWSRWIDAAPFQMRYRVQLEPLPAKPLTDEEAEAQQLHAKQEQFRALAADAPLGAWLAFTSYGNPEELQKAAAAAILKRPDFVREMSQAMVGEDRELAQLALRSLGHFPEKPVVLTPAVEAVGQQLVTLLKAFADSGGGDASGISTTFSAWMEAVRALQGQDGVTFIPVLQEIAQLSRQSRENHLIALDVLRVASYYLNEWAGIAPLPGDPPPR